MAISKPPRVSRKGDDHVADATVGAASGVGTAAGAFEGSAQRKTAAYGNVGRIRRIIAPAAARPFALVESAIFMVIVLAILGVLRPADPLALTSPFPWIWLAPLVLALRYGTLIGLLGGGIMLAEWVFIGHNGVRSGAFPVAFFAGGFIEIIVVGHFGDTWGARAIQASAKNDYLADRLVALTNNHYLLRLSHDRLEKDLLSQPTTLRDSIVELRRMSVQGGLKDPGESALAAEHLLRYIAPICRLEQAAFYPVRNGRIGVQAMAIFGEPFDLAPNDALITHALENGALAHLKMEEGELPDSLYLVCAPLLAADGSTRGMLVIRRMPFLSLTLDNLQLIQVLLGYFGDGLEYAELVRHVIDIVPDCPVEFALELSRLGRMAGRTGVHSSLVSLTFPRSESSDSLFEHVSRRRRALDVFWEIQTAEHSIVVNLMPVTDIGGINGYLARIESSLRAQFATDLETARVAVHTQLLGDLDPALVLQRILTLSGVDD
ncbi:PelD GGDEF domain-containing protein [Robbsia sp. KACC 23696]|uniref:PelD GGDEF domain-containing protein n=1 Tax=Robbsia sp. KACC 23696 TaxID=3149231 RepID=UPI00325A5DDB